MIPFGVSWAKKPPRLQTLVFAGMKEGLFHDPVWSILGKKTAAFCKRWFFFGAPLTKAWRLSTRRSKKKPKAFTFGFVCGGRGIRTPGPVTVNSFQDCRNRPLCHSSNKSVLLGFSVSGCKYSNLFDFAKTIFVKNRFYLAAFFNRLIALGLGWGSVIRVRASEKDTMNILARVAVAHGVGCLRNCCSCDSSMACSMASNSFLCWYSTTVADQSTWLFLMRS